VELISKVIVIADAARKRYEPSLKVVLKDGSILDWKEESGDSSYRLTWEGAARMTYRLCNEVDVPESLASALIDEVNAIEKRPNIESLISSICAATLDP